MIIKVADLISNNFQTLASSYVASPATRCRVNVPCLDGLLHNKHSTFFSKLHKIKCFMLNRFEVVHDAFV